MELLEYALICFDYRSDNLKHAKPKGVQLIEFK